MLVSRSGHKVDFKVDEKKLKRLLELKIELGDDFPKFGIFILCYNASLLIESTLSRIDPKLKSIIEEVFIFDDNSPDGTFEVIKSLTSNSPWAEKINIFKNSTNLRYGGNQKVGYRYAIERGLDYSIMLHGDGQYAPEYIVDLILPAVEDKYDVVFASRMMVGNSALRGGMPLYKYVGNKVLTTFENFILGTRLTEFHSGYRMYSSKFLKKIPFHENTDDFHFDTEIIIQARHLGVPIKEVPIQAFYGDEDCNVNGFLYAFDVCKAVLFYRFHQLHFIRKPNYIVDRRYIHQRKKNRFSSHQIILNQIQQRDKRVLYVGKDEDLLVGDLVERGMKVTLLLDDTLQQENYKAVSIRKLDMESESLGLGREKYDVIILSDVLAKVPNPTLLIEKCSNLINGEEGQMIASVPNIAIWAYRLSLLFGRFNYASAGPLDRRNLRHFTRFSLIRLFKTLGIKVVKIEPTTLPLEVYFQSSGRSRLIKLLEGAYYLLCRSYSQLFAYQFVSVVKLKSTLLEAK